jgi:hypothetical protein
LQGPPKFTQIEFFWFKIINHLATQASHHFVDNYDKHVRTKTRRPRRRQRFNNNLSSATSGLPDFSWYKTPKLEKIYQNGKMCIYQMTICKVDQMAEQ